MGLFAYTTAEELFIFISGYPYMKGNFDFEEYNAYRVLQLGVSVIILLYEAINFYKRLMYFITCQMVSKDTIINNVQKYN